jgi:predicted nucleic acid-binding Zn ribbon protein
MHKYLGVSLITSISNTIVELGFSLDKWHAQPLDFNKVQSARHKFSWEQASNEEKTLVTCEEQVWQQSRDGAWDCS